MDSCGKAFQELPFPAGSTVSFRAACMDLCFEETHKLLHTDPNFTWYPRFAWAYQQLVDVRYEWATRSDQRVNQPANSPVSDALFFLDGKLPANASTGPPDSLQYYLAILEYNAVGSTNQKSLGGMARSLSCVACLKRRVSCWRREANHWCPADCDMLCCHLY